MILGTIQVILQILKLIPCFCVLQLSEVALILGWK